MDPIHEALDAQKERIARAIEFGRINPDNSIETWRKFHAWIARNIDGLAAPLSPREA